MEQAGTTVSASPALSAAFAALGRILLGEERLDAVLQRVAEAAKQATPAAAYVSITLLDPRATGSGEPRVRTVAFTSELCLELDERQYESGRGPCLDAAASGATIAVASATDEQYPHFSRAASARGVRHVLALGLPIAQRTVGALNLYGLQDPFSAADVAVAESFAGVAAVAVANAALYDSTADLAENLQVAMRSRAVIEQAKGVLMAERGVGADDAFELLRVASRHTNRKLRDIAVDVVAAATAGPGGARPPLA